MSAGLSVVMPTFNGERFIGDALASLCGPGAPDEVIVVDDGSADRTLEIADSYADRLALKILRPEPRRNWVAMTNLGLDVAGHHWTAILHQDDMWTPGRRRALDPHLHADADLIVQDAQFIDDSGRPVGPWRVPRSVRRRPEHLAAALYVQNWIALPAVTFRTDAGLAEGGLDERLWYTADWDLWLKLSRRTPPILAAGCGAAFRIHGSSQTVTGSADPDDMRDQLASVQTRHRWAADLSEKPERTVAAGALSTESNVMLGSAIHGRPDPRPWISAAVKAIRIGAGPMYLRDSAVMDRVAARLRARISHQARDHHV